MGRRICKVYECDAKKCNKEDKFNYGMEAQHDDEAIKKGWVCVTDQSDKNKWYCPFHAKEMLNALQ